MENNSNSCPICGGNLNSLGAGKVCSNCGYARIDSPVANEIAVQARNKKITIIALIVLIGWIIPSIILHFFK